MKSETIVSASGHGFCCVIYVSMDIGEKKDYMEVTLGEKI